MFLSISVMAPGRNRPGIEVVQTLERLGLPFTGATSNFYEPTREMMKRVCHFWGIKALLTFLAADSQSVELAPSRSGFRDRQASQIAIAAFA